MINRVVTQNFHCKVKEDEHRNVNATTGSTAQQQRHHPEGVFLCTKMNRFFFLGAVSVPLTPELAGAAKRRRLYEPLDASPINVR